MTSRIAQNPNAQPAELITSLQNLLGANWKQSIALVSFFGTIDPENIFPAVLLYSVPVGIKGLLLAAMLAAMMSCLAGTLNGTIAMFTKDIYNNFLRPKASNRELISMSWVATILLVAASFWMGVFAKNINDLWAWIIMGLGAGALGPGVLRLYWWRTNAWGCCLGQILGGGGAIIQRIVFPEMPELLQFTIMTGFSFGGTIVGSLLTPATDGKTLTEFYRRTKPFGFWRPLFNQLSASEQIDFRDEQRNDLIAVPFALLAQVTLFMLGMQVIIHQFEAMAVTGVLFLIGALGLYKFWWIPLKKL